MNELIIKLDTIKQGSQPTVTFTWPLPSSHMPTNFTGAVIVWHNAPQRLPAT
jgi:hypothetical protein